MPAPKATVDLYAPLRISLYWLVGTFVGFLLIGEVQKVNNLPLLMFVVFAFTAAFTLGYWRRAIGYRSAAPPPARETIPDIQRREIQQLVALSALYYLAYGIVYLREYGMTTPGALMRALLNPGAAYLAKFEVYERQAALGSVNTAAQVLTLLAVLSAPLVPFLVVYWRHLTADLRILSAIGLAAYSSFFLAIATRSGLGHVLAFAGVAFLVTRAQGGQNSGARRHRRLVTAGVLAGIFAFLAYMSYSQGNRITEIGGSLEYKYQANPIVEALTNEEFAVGVTAMAFYPTHGYQGLAYNLQSPFVWTHGQGASRAVDSYVAQYGLADSVRDRTYPARTEALTGWPADALWATIYPWLASDLTWYGVPVFMFVLGWWTARWWYEAVVEQSRLALLLLCQVGLLIAFIPANNQIGISRPHTIALFTLLFLYFLSRLRLNPGHRGRKWSTNQQIQKCS